MRATMRSTRDALKFSAPRLCAPILIAVALTLAASDLGATDTAPAIESAPTKSSPQASHETSPLAAATLDKYYEAIGGDAWDGVENLFQSGTVSVSRLGTRDGTFSSYLASPGESYLVTDIDGLGHGQRGVKDNIAWGMHEFEGVWTEKNSEREYHLNEAHNALCPHWRDHFSKVEYAGERMLGGRTCKKIKMTPWSGRPQTWFFDSATGLLLRKETEVKRVAGDSEFESLTYEKYRRVEGLLVAVKWTEKRPFYQATWTVNEVSFNLELEDGTFDLPDEVVRIVDDPSLARPRRPMGGSVSAIVATAKGLARTGGGSAARSRRSGGRRVATASSRSGRVRSRLGGG